MTTGRYDEGMAVRREVLGGSYVEQASARTTDFTRDFQQIVTEFAWGTVWARPGLDRRRLIALGHHDELALHLRGALPDGLTREEMPAADAAFRVAQRVLDELEQQPDPTT